MIVTEGKTDLITRIHLCKNAEHQPVLDMQKVPNRTHLCKYSIYVQKSGGENKKCISKR